MWEQMTLEQRAQLWPLLTHEQRLLRWRHMTQDERRIMRKNMTPVERKNLKRRFVIDRLPPEEAKNLKTRKMTPAERELLRRQVIEVHVEMRGGVPTTATTRLTVGEPVNSPALTFINSVKRSLPKPRSQSRQRP